MEYRYLPRMVVVTTELNHCIQNSAWLVKSSIHFYCHHLKLMESKTGLLTVSPLGSSCLVCRRCSINIYPLNEIQGFSICTLDFTQFEWVIWPPELPVLLPGFQGLLYLGPENTPYIEAELQLADLPFIWKEQMKGIYFFPLSVLLSQNIVLLL